MNAWAKRAADEIVSDDTIDEADADRTSTSDWTKWALAAAALGAAGFAAWRYSPEIMGALKSTKLYSTKALSNELLEKVPVVGQMSSSPAVWGGLAGAAGQAPFLPAAIRESVVLNGKDAPLRTITGQSQLAALAGTNQSGAWHADLSRSQLAEEVRRGIGGNDNAGYLSKLTSAGVQDSNSAFGRLRTADFDKPTGDWATHKGQALSADTGLGRSAAAADMDRIVANSAALDRRLGGSVEYQVPGQPALTRRTLSEVPDTERIHLPPEHRFAWDAHRQLATEAGADPAKFRFGEIGKGLGANRASLRSSFSAPRTLRNAGVGFGAGWGLGALVDGVGSLAP